jgi:hypothetical protein
MREQLSQAEIAIHIELEKARAKFPSNRMLLHAFQEEAGEVTRAFLQLYEATMVEVDPVQIKTLCSDIRKELVQAAAMAVRLYEEGDPEFPWFKGAGKP